MKYFVSITRDRVKVSLPEGELPGSVTFAGDAPIRLPVEAGAGIHLVAARQIRDGDHWAVCIGVANDRGYLVKRGARSVTALGDGKVHGPYAVWVTPEGDVSWVPASDPFKVHHLDGTVTDSRATTHPLSQDAHSRENLGPVTVTRVVKDGQWVMGEDIHAPTGSTRLYAKREGGQCQHVWSGYSSLPAQMAAHSDGTCTVAVQIPHGSDKATFVHSTNFTVFEVPPIPVPDRPRAIWRGMTGGGPGNATWGPDQTMRPVLGSPVELELSRVPGWVFFSPKDDPNPEAALLAAVVSAKRHDVPVAVYWDAGDYSGGWEWLERVRREGVKVVRGVQAYPGPPGRESMEETVGRIASAIDDSRGYQDLVIRPIYTQQGNWPLGTVLGLQGALDTIIAGRPHIVGDFAFGRSRKPGCYDDTPQLQTYWTLLCARTPTPAADAPVEPEPPAPSPTRPPDADPARRQLGPGDALRLGERVSGPDGFSLVLQHDGNLVLQGPSGPVWASGTEWQSVTEVAMQHDGNLVINGAGGPVWASGTWGHSGARLVVRAGQVAIVRDNADVWASAVAPVAEPPLPPPPPPQPPSLPPPPPVEEPREKMGFWDRLLSLFRGRRPSRPPQAPDPSPQLWNFSLTVMSDGAPLEGATATVLDGPFMGARAVSVSGGFADFGPRPQADFNVSVTCPGHHEIRFGVHLFHHEMARPVTLESVKKPSRSGSVRVEGRVFADGDGPWNPLGVTLFWALWGEKHDPDRLDRNLAYLADRGVDYIRMLGMVGAPSWEDRTIDPNAPDYWTVAAHLFDRLERHGLRAQVTVFADAQVMMPDLGQRGEFLRRWADFANARRDRMFAFEVANEAWQNGFDGVAILRELGNQLVTQTDIPVALSSVPQESGAWCEAYAGAGVDFATVHFDRDTGLADGAWRPVRQPWGYPHEYEIGCEGQLPRAYANNEPIGPQSSVAADDDPTRLAMAYATTFVAGGGAYVYHPGAGIRGGGAADLQRGRPANFYDANDDALSAISAVKRLLPEGLAGWTRHNAQWPSMPWNGFAAAVDRHDLIRAYAATSGARVVLVLLGIKAPLTVTSKDAMTLELYDPRDASSRGTVHLEAGQSWSISDDRPGVIAIGSFGA